MEKTSSQVTEKTKEIRNVIDDLSEHKFFGVIVNKLTNVASEKLKTKIIEIVKMINSDKINCEYLKKIVFEGLPDDIPSLRSLIWKLLLYYLPLNVNEWEESIDAKRLDYFKMKKEIFSKLDLERLKKGSNKQKNNDREVVDTSDANKMYNSEGVDASLSQGTTKKVLKKKNISDHPLSVGQDSQWKSYFDDLELLEEVDKDIRRTRTNMHFFFMPAKTNLNPISNEQITELADKKRNDPGKSVDKLFQKESFESNADIMCRILFIYGKRYPDVRYIQGMNEILAPIYYTFSNDQNPYFYTNLEADSYLCFENLMTQIKDIFLRSKDNLETGIQTKIKNLSNLLKIVDKEIYSHFAEHKVEIQFFAFRWYTLFLTQEFEMPDILRLWDSILSTHNKFDFLNMVCLAIIKAKKTEIMQSDFAGIMLALQNLDKLDIEKIIKTGETIQTDLCKNIY